MVWGDSVPWLGSMTVDPNHIVWGDTAVWVNHIVWGDSLLGILEGNHVVWGEHIVWGDSLLTPANTVWKIITPVDKVKDKTKDFVGGLGLELEFLGLQ